MTATLDPRSDEAKILRRIHHQERTGRRLLSEKMLLATMPYVEHRAAVEAIDRLRSDRLIGREVEAGRYVYRLTLAGREAIVSLLLRDES